MKSKNKILVTGGCGFIGSNFINYIFSILNKDDLVYNLDKQTYAGQGKNIEHLKIDKDKRYFFVKGDIADKSLVFALFKKEKFDIVFNFAAESFVDRSFENVEIFKRSNVLGTGVLLEASAISMVQKFIQVSTDEVYGSIEKGSFDENSELNPTNPYSKSKAEAEAIALHYRNVIGLPVYITRGVNNYGEYQFPEKVIPLFITNLLENKKIPLMWSKENPGLNVRDWLHVKDYCRAIWFVSQFGKSEIYNVSGNNETTNMNLTTLILRNLGYTEKMIKKIPHRKTHDFRYSVNANKLKDLGFKYEHLDFEKELLELCQWYKKNEKWWRPLKKYEEKNDNKRN